MRPSLHSSTHGLNPCPSSSSRQGHSVGKGATGKPHVRASHGFHVTSDLATDAEFVYLSSNVLYNKLEEFAWCPGGPFCRAGLVLAGAMMARTVPVFRVPGGESSRECLVSGKTEEDVSISIYPFQFTYNAYQHVYIFICLVSDRRQIHKSDRRSCSTRYTHSLPRHVVCWSGSGLARFDQQR